MTDARGGASLEASVVMDGIIAGCPAGRSRRAGTTDARVSSVDLEKHVKNKVEVSKKSVKTIAARKRRQVTGRPAVGGDATPLFDLASMNRVAMAVRQRADARRAARIISDDVIGQPVSV